MGGTDTKHYIGLSKDVYRFAPTKVGPNDLPRIHGTNERIATKDFEQCVRFYRRLVQNCSQPRIE
jgi:carboxypeptidase PM20D1